MLGVDVDSAGDHSILRIPSKSVLRRNMIRLDMSMMSWEQHCWANGMQRVASLFADGTEKTRCVDVLSAFSLLH